VQGPWSEVTLEKAVEVAPLLTQQDPELNRAGTPAATMNSVGNGRVATFHGPVFKAYHQAHYPLLRQFIGDAIAALDGQGLIHLEGPWWIEMSARKKEGKTLIQLVNRAGAGHLAPNRHMVESIPDTGPFSVTIPVPEKPKRCHLTPDEEGLEWTWKGGVLTARISGLAIHNALAIE
jgi:hypothetical protein